MDQVSIKITGDLQRLSPKHGDVFVLSCAQGISTDMAERLRAHLVAYLGEKHKVIVLGDGLTLSVADGEEA